ncbi:hypothetical protein KQI84_18685 [bacterium]|nr:hypothetical protein [bacterium]
MTKAANTNFEDEFLLKLIRTIEKQLENGVKRLPWHSTHYLVSHIPTNALKHFSYSGESCPNGVPYTGNFNRLLLFLVSQIASERRGLPLDCRFACRSDLKRYFNAGVRIKRNPYVGEKTDLSHYIMVKVFRPITSIREVPNEDFNPALPESTNNARAKKVYVPTGRYALGGSVLSILDTNLLEIGMLGKDPATIKRENPPLTKVQRVIDSLPCLWREANETPHYSLRTHEITIPPRSQAKSSLVHAQTCLHEIAHFLGHCLGEFSEIREIKQRSFEELVAEFTGTYVLGQLGYLTDCAPEYANSVSYLNNWMAALHDQPSMLLKAAQRAVVRGNIILSGKIDPKLVYNLNEFPFLRDSLPTAA